MLGGGLLALALAGGAATYAVAAFSGGGAQPESLIPSSALAMVRVDLDPSAGQKIDALRFARKFPDAKSRLGSSDDPRRALFDSLRLDSTLSGDWEKDVEPWLGQRAAVAVLPGATAADEPKPIVVLAVTDEAEARTGLARVVGSAGGCVVADEFAVCAQDRAVASRAVSDAEKSSLADNATFDTDIGTLGSSLAVGWADLAKIKAAVPALSKAVPGMAGSGLGGALGGAAGGNLTGRYMVALRFDGPHLELAGRVAGSKLLSTTGSSGIGDLPAGTVAAVGVGGADQLVAMAWDQLEATVAAAGPTGALDEQVAQIKQQYGIDVPSDISAAVGKQLVVAYGGGTEGDIPRVAVRLGGSAEKVTSLVAAANDALGGELTLAQASAGASSSAGAGGTVVASSTGYASEVAGGSGLGSSKVFQDAVPDAANAQQVMFVDVAAALAIASQYGMPTQERRNLEPLAAVGVTVSHEASDATFRARLTTK